MSLEVIAKHLTAATDVIKAMMAPVPPAAIPLGMSDLERLIKLRIERAHDDYMSDGRYNRPPKTEESKLTKMFEELLAPEWTKDAPMLRLGVGSEFMWGDLKCRITDGVIDTPRNGSGLDGLYVKFNAVGRYHDVECAPRDEDAPPHGAYTDAMDKCCGATVVPHLTKYIFRCTWLNGAVGNLFEFGENVEHARSMVMQDNPGLKAAECIGFADA